jgi:hypothetical protein
MLISVAAHFNGRRGTLPKSLWSEITRRYDQAGDSSAYGLMNAITAVARDERDPETKWRMEELGGGILAMLKKRRAPGRRRRFVQVV